MRYKNYDITLVYEYANGKSDFEVAAPNSDTALIKSKTTLDSVIRDIDEIECVKSPISDRLFMGTKGDFKMSFVSGVCIGVESDMGSDCSQVVCNSILPDTDAEYVKEKREIEANMRLFANSKNLLISAVQVFEVAFDNRFGKYSDSQLYEQFIKLGYEIKKSLSDQS